jgi:methyl-accepting chemotaxis protein
MAELASLYRINETNLGLRREFLGLTERDVATIRRLARWGDRVADGIAREFYDHQFAFAPTAAFFSGHAQTHGVTVEKLRGMLEKSQAGYFRDIFAEAAEGGRFGVPYFERRLRVGRLHNTIDLPLKWYVGSYVSYFDLVRRHLRRRYPHRPRMRARAERAILAVMNADIQAIVEAFYFDTFAAMGVDLEAVEVENRSEDLSDRSGKLKQLVRGPLEGITHALTTLKATSAQLATASDEAGRAVNEIADSVADVAIGAERQVKMINDARVTAEQTAEVAVEAQKVSESGVTAANQAGDAMDSVSASSKAVSGVMSELSSMSSEIGTIVQTITSIAGQTNLLALNAAIEAARAGDQGRGFAVVAEEVRKLAEESQNAAKQIAGLISRIQQGTATAVDAVADSGRQTDDGVVVVEQAKEAFRAITERVEEMATRIGYIVEASTQVAGVAESSSASAEQVSAVTQETSATAHEVATAAADLAHTADELEQIVAGFKLSTDSSTTVPETS